MDIQPYKNRQEKDKNYWYSEYIDNEHELGKILSQIKANETDFLYRGVNNAGFKMFSSSQREWLRNTQLVQNVGMTDYYCFVSDLITRTAALTEVHNYMQKENVSYNEFFILALMQHFGIPSPMLDFSTSMEKSLFFATDGALKGWQDDGSDSLNNYVSLYLLPNKVDWVYTTLQSVMQNAANDINWLLADAKQNDPILYNSLTTKEVEDKIRKALFSQFRLGPDSDIKFLPVNGPADGRVKISIPILNFQCDYYIINDRLLAQEGLFIANFTTGEPLVEVMNEVCKNKYFRCLNIRKNLIPQIISNCLLPKGIDANSVYMKGNAEVNTLQTAMDNMKAAIR